MKISARSRYATRILIDLAMNDDDAPVRTTFISERTGITVQFIEQILKPLRQAELVVSKRGATGGYHLNKPASEVSLGEIVRTMEGSLSLTDCCDDAELCSRTDICLTRDAWKRISTVLANALDSIKLSDIIDGLPPQCESLKGDLDDIRTVC
ncbi:MAG: Rrf2 family transcriptional regulator [Desulfomicrobium sp.]|nr:Rrf2 family transcriptional regulator [Pseudomonadota bacterium]MBV1710816.1 Rrf2 family transcriptional regulator [Desulfomicrobium sp.]MBU4571443.1 Rrf2 family transcriptional regulator [Pseudomonadota bacterium]MBU4594431.1 Rrf2 family transcriptional regulator [Pseudomonadota bacterium]MBV1720248.1 Rrf2 family transcriptional regulator [Desulfomicrobium sp.]